MKENEREKKVEMYIPQGHTLFDMLDTKKCPQRTTVKNAGKGMEGLSLMSDRDVLERVYASKHGDTIKRLMNGEDLRNNHSNSDMLLANHLAFWCNGDPDQMMRIMQTSGLYRPEKSDSYYESRILKAIEGTSLRYTPKGQSPKTPPHRNASDKGGK